MNTAWIHGTILNLFHEAVLGQRNRTTPILMIQVPEQEQMQKFMGLEIEKPNGISNALKHKKITVGAVPIFIFFQQRLLVSNTNTYKSINLYFLLF